MKRVLVIDDDPAFVRLLQNYVAAQFPALTFVACTDPVQGLAAVDTDLDLLLVDLEMPGLDGSKILAYAAARGVSRNRIVILSGRDADYLHQLFPMGSCLAVLNKHEARQRAVLEMIFTSLHGKCLAPGPA